jgi:Asp-tRNA(Asn)/Glu-tRNA(Gln) amidotransferase A subunit family amidase
MLPVSLGTQTNGSTIRPASYNGIFALKASLGALSMAGIHPLSVTLDHLAVLAGSLEDTWLVSHFISNAAGSPGHPGLMGEPTVPAEKKPRRFARLYTTGWEELDDETIAGFEDFVSGLKSAGVEVLSREENPKLSELEKYLDDYVEEVLDILAYEMRWPMSEYLRHHEDMMGPRIHEFMKRSSEISQETFRALLVRRAEAQERVMNWRAEVDGFLTLSSSGPAIVNHEFTGSRTFLLYWSWLGFPSFNLPLLTSGGLPVGVQLMGFRNEDHRLAALANWISTCFFSR